MADAFKKLLPEEVIPLDPQRMVRRLELADAGQSLVTDRAEHLVYDGPVIGITMDRSVLYDRINKRVHQMIERGLKEEVAALLIAGVPENSQAFKGIGYKEMIPVLHGEYSLEEAEALIAKEYTSFCQKTANLVPPHALYPLGRADRYGHMAQGNRSVCDFMDQRRIRMEGKMNLQDTF